jgi:hypothetical protein
MPAPVAVLTPSSSSADRTFTISPPLPSPISAWNEATSKWGAKPIPAPAADDALFEFDRDACLLTKTSGHGDGSPQHVVWQFAVSSAVGARHHEPTSGA